MLLLLFLIIFHFSASAQTRDLHYERNLTPLNIVPTFDHGYLVVYDWDHKIDVFAPDGALMYGVAAQGRGADWSMIENAAVDSDGTLAAAIRAVTEPGIAGGGGIAVFDRTGTQIRFMDTGDYLPTQLAFGPDHSIWAIGWRREDARNPTADYSVLRNYSRYGEQLGQYLRRSSFLSVEHTGFQQPLIMPMLGLWTLRVENGAVEALFHQPRLWVQTDLNGWEKGRWDVGPNRRPTAITQDGKAWRKAQRWTPASGV